MFFFCSRYSSSSLMLIGLSGFGIFNTSSKCSFHLFVHSSLLPKIFPSLSFITDCVLFLSLLSVHVIAYTVFILPLLATLSASSIKLSVQLPSVSLHAARHFSTSIFDCIFHHHSDPSFCPVCSSVSYVLSLYILLLKSTSLH